MKYFIIFLVLLIPSQSAFALYDDSLLSNGLDFKPLTGARVNTFQDSRVDWCIHTGNLTYGEIAKISIKEWKERLTETTGKDVWNMKVHVNTLYKKICDGHIWFKEMPQRIDHKLHGVAGLSQKYTPLPEIVIYTADYQKELIQIFEDQIKGLTDEDIEEMLNSINHQNQTGKNIERIIKHELGHALSLFHPFDAWNAKGIMSYNIDELEILDKEIWQIVHTYPNGFNGIQKNQFGVKIDQSNNLQHVITTGEWINLTIEIPIKNNLRVTDMDLRIYSGNGDETKFYFGGLVEIPDNDHFAEITTLYSYFVKNKIQFHIGFIPLHEDILDFKIILIDVTGQESQYDLKHVIKIQDALFSKELVKNPQKLKTFSASSAIVNQEIEKEKMEFENAKAKYYEELKKCLKVKNGKYCKAILGSFVLTEKPQVPGWIKNNAKWWSEGNIGDSDFVSGIQFMIKAKIINIPDLPEQASETAEEKVPDWIKNNAGWWADGLITEDDFVKGIQYWVEQGVIKV